MPRYELERGAVMHYCELVLDGEVLAVARGEDDDPPQAMERAFDSEDEAREGYERLVNELRRLGYQLVGEGEAEEALAPAATNRELEEAIDESPDDLQRLLVYADWLQAQGDPRGEYLALSADPGRQAAAEAFLARQPGTLRGRLEELEGDDDLAEPRLTWRWGLVQKLTLERARGEDLDVAHLVGQVASHPAGRFLTDLTLDLAYDAGDVDLDELAVGQGESVRFELANLVRALESQPLRALRRFELSLHGARNIDLGDLGPLLACMPRLEELVLIDGAPSRIKGPPRLRRLAIQGHAVHAETLLALAATSWPALERLELELPLLDRRGPDEELATLLAAGNAPRLREFVLQDVQDGDVLCRVLLASPILGQLEVLSLERCRITDQGAALLRAGRDKLARLSALRLRLNHVQDLRPLRELGITVQGLEHQIAPHDDDDDDEETDDEDDDYYDPAGE